MNDYRYSDYVDDAFFLEGLCAFKQAPRAERDQTKSYEALDRLNRFVQTFPSSSRLAEAREVIHDVHLRSSARRIFSPRSSISRKSSYDALLVYLNKIIDLYPETVWAARSLYYRGRIEEARSDNAAAARRLSEGVSRRKSDFPEETDAERRVRLLRNGRREEPGSRMAARTGKDRSLRRLVRSDPHGASHPRAGRGERRRARARSFHSDRGPASQAGRFALTDIETRTSMVELAIAGNPRFELSRVEAERGVSYTFQTVSPFADRGFGKEEIHLLIGSDSLAEMGGWRKPAEIFSRATILVMQRPGSEQSRIFPPEAAVICMTAGTNAISSSAIRPLVREGKSIRYLVPDAVERFIASHSLYGSKP